MKVWLRVSNLNFESRQTTILRLIKQLNVCFQSPSFKLGV